MFASNEFDCFDSYCFDSNLGKIFWSLLIIRLEFIVSSGNLIDHYANWFIISNLLFNYFFVLFCSQLQLISVVFMVIQLGCSKTDLVILAWMFHQ